jgi:hypothetical protein
MLARARIVLLVFAILMQIMELGRIVAGINDLVGFSIKSSLAVVALIAILGLVRWAGREV